MLYKTYVLNGAELLFRLVPGGTSVYGWQIARWSVALLLLIGALLCLYRFPLTVRRQCWGRLIPGSVIAASIWIAISAILRLYVRHLSDFGLLYGSLATLIILMLWLYRSGIAILFDREINSTLGSSTGER